MKNLLKYSLLPLLMTISCATGPQYQGPPVAKADPYKTACTVFDIKIASIYTDGWKKKLETVLQRNNLEILTL